MVRRNPLRHAVADIEDLKAKDVEKEKRLKKVETLLHQ